MARLGVAKIASTSGRVKHVISGRAVRLFGIARIRLAMARCSMSCTEANRKKERIALRRVSRSGVIASDTFEVVQERQDRGRIQIRNRQIARCVTRSILYKFKKQPERVAVSRYRSGAAPFVFREVLRKKALDERGEAQRWRHWPPPAPWGARNSAVAALSS